MNTLSRTEQASSLKERLTESLTPTTLNIIDDSDAHIGHSGAEGGKGHFIVEIASDKFEGLAKLAVHRLVYEAAGDLLPTHIHALQIKVIN